jgi:predicted type IV restriction endonuclease
MPLEAALVEIVTRLREGRFPNEQSISQGVVLRILQELSWDTWDTSVVWPEYQTGQGRADYALCHPALKPIVTIEVKQMGKAEDAVRQALQYAFDVGVPFVVLTDGRTWGFYLPAEQGSYEERRVQMLDLFERTTQDAADTLRHYLARDRVESGAAIECARQEYRSKNRRARARAAIPAAWKELVEKGDEYLVEILTSATESKEGVRPDEDDVAEFLEQLGRSTATVAAPVGRVETRNGFSVQTSSSAHIPPPRRGTLILRAKTYPYNNAKEAMVIVLRELAKNDSTFLQRCAQHPDAQGRKRRYIARAVDELYPDRPDLREFNEALPGGWFVSTNLNNVLKKSIIRLAAQVAGLHFGEDIVVDF